MAGNRLTEVWEVDKISELPHLMEATFLNNPMARKPNYRTALIKRLATMIVLDGQEIPQEERQRIEF
jgi:hypothetical protein